MKIKYLAHSSFLISSAEGVRIITDPYKTGAGLNYSAIDEKADIVTVSHGHGDHNNPGSIKGGPEVIREAGQQTVKGIEIKGVPVHHDETGGSQRGANVMFCFRIDGMNVCHAGDLGHRLKPEQVSALGQVDVLFIPVGGYYTINAEEAWEVVRAVRPRVVIPMHYKTARSDYPIAAEDDFAKGGKKVLRLDSSEVEFAAGSLPAETEVVVLKPSL